MANTNKRAITQIKKKCKICIEKINTIGTYYFKTYFQNARQCIKRMMHAKSLCCSIERRFVPLNRNVIKGHKNVPRKMRVPYV